MYHREMHLITSSSCAQDSFRTKNEGEMKRLTWLPNLDLDFQVIKKKQKKTFGITFCCTLRSELFHRLKVSSD